jgi:hypothetical protein
MSSSVFEPWRNAFSEERCLPASVRGPVECWELVRVMATLLMEPRKTDRDPLCPIASSGLLWRRGLAFALAEGERGMDVIGVNDAFGIADIIGKDMGVSSENIAHDAAGRDCFRHLASVSCGVRSQPG